MPTPVDPTVLYPDVAALDSLAAALVAAAEGRLTTVPVTSPEPEPLLHAAVGSVVPHRSALLISAWTHQRRWSIRGTDRFQGLPLVDGTTDDLAEVAKAARPWHDGTDLDGVREAASFAHLTGAFEVPDLDPARMAESEWHSLRREAAELSHPWAESYRTLVEAAHSAPALRALYPFTSHWALRFSTSTRPRMTVVGPCLTAGGDGTYRVSRGFGTPDLGRFATADEAVALAVRHLPPGLGPVVPGGTPPGI